MAPAVVLAVAVRQSISATLHQCNSLVAQCDNLVAQCDSNQCISAIFTTKKKKFNSLDYPFLGLEKYSKFITQGIEMKLFNFQQDGYFSSRGHSEIPKISFLRQNVFVKIPFLGLLFYSLGYHILNPRNGHF